MKRNVFAVYKDGSSVEVGVVEGTDLHDIYRKVDKRSNTFKRIAAEHKKEQFRLRKQQHEGQISDLVRKGRKDEAELLELQPECYAFAGFNLTGEPIEEIKLTRL